MLFNLNRLVFVFLGGGGLAMLTYLSGLGYVTVAQMVGVPVSGGVLSILLSGVLINLILWPAIFHFNRQMVKSRIEALFPLESVQQLSQNDKLFLAGLLHKQYKKLNDRIYKLMRRERYQGPGQPRLSRRELSYLFNRRDLFRYFRNKLASERELSRPDLEILNLMLDPRLQVKFEVIHLTRLQVEYRDKPEEKIEKVNELRDLGYRFLEGFGYIKVHEK